MITDKEQLKYLHNFKGTNHTADNLLLFCTQGQISFNLYAFYGSSLSDLLNSSSFNMQPLFTC